jgi:hypothetical protein
MADNGEAPQKDGAKNRLSDANGEEWKSMATISAVIAYDRMCNS